MIAQQAMINSIAKIIKTNAIVTISWSFDPAVTSNLEMTSVLRAKN
jgi:hypothetical protein